MDSSSKLVEFFWAILVQFPSLITILLCMFYVAKRRRAYPRISLPALISLVLLFLLGPFFSAVFLFGLDLLSSSGNRHRVFLTLAGLNYVALAIAFVPLLVAIFMRRGAAQSSHV